METSSGRRGKLAAAIIVGLGAAAAAAKLGYEATVEPTVRAHIAGLRAELAALDPAPLLSADHRGLRERLAGQGHYNFFIQYRDKAVGLLAEEHWKDRGREGASERAAWLLLLLKIDSPRSLLFFEEALPSVREPDLRREVESYLARHAHRR